MEEKYVVFDKVRFEQWIDTCQMQMNELCRLHMKRTPGSVVSIDFGAVDRIPGKIDDAVVIREQDIFAGPALEMYSAAITTALRLLPNEDATVRRLTQIRNYFRRCADRAYEKATKVPD